MLLAAIKDLVPTYRPTPAQPIETSLSALAPANDSAPAAAPATGFNRLPGLAWIDALTNR
jgi:hypothetical protein